MGYIEGYENADYYNQLGGLEWSAYLPKCLESIASQDLRDFELLILDNGSTDGTREF